MDLAELTRRQRFSLWLDGRPGLHAREDAVAFMSDVALALRYAPAQDVPLASLYRATQRHVPVPEEETPAHARAFDLTNALLATGQVVETNLIADRLVLAHERVVPAIYALRRGSRDADLSPSAREALEFIELHESASSGEVRRHLRAEGQRRPDVADLALTELQRELLIDRGPSRGPTTGVFYLTKEGYPYRLFSEAHPRLVAMASDLRREEAASRLLQEYLAGAVFATPRKLRSMFKLLLRPDDIAASIASLGAGGVVEQMRVGRQEVFVYHSS